WQQLVSYLKRFLVAAAWDSPAHTRNLVMLNAVQCGFRGTKTGPGPRLRTTTPRPRARPRDHGGASPQKVPHVAVGLRVSRRWPVWAAACAPVSAGRVAAGAERGRWGPNPYPWGEP